MEGQRFERTLRFMFLADEEPPFFQNPGMGPLGHARASAERSDRVIAMVALESLGHMVVGATRGLCSQEPRASGRAAGTCLRLDAEMLEER